jgi:hypothetical protein
MEATDNPRSIVGLRRVAFLVMAVIVRRDPALSVVWGCWWGALLAVAIWIATGTDRVLGLRAVSIASLVFGVWVFVTHGRRRITAVGVYSLGMAVFGGFAGLALSYSSPRPLRWVDVLAGMLVFGTQVATWAVFWRKSDGNFESVQGRPAVGARTLRWGVVSGMALLGLGATTTTFVGGAGPLPTSTAYVGALLAAASALARRGTAQRHRRRIVGLIASGLMFGVYVSLLFTGFGRLVVAGLGLAMAVAGGRFVFRRSAKMLVVVAALPALMIFGSIRGDDDVVSGLGSVTEPLTVFADIIEATSYGEIDSTPGSTFAAAVVAQVPGALWSSKPDGFGRELTAQFKPDLLPANHSMAALTHGEWWWNFSWWGMVLMVPVTGVALRWLDRRLAYAYGAPLTNRRNLLALVMTSTATAGLLDLFWVGTFTYSARTITSVGIIAIMMLRFRQPTEFERATR